MLDFADFDRKFELKASEASGDLIARKEQGGSVWAQLSDDCKEYICKGVGEKHTCTRFGLWFWRPLAVCSAGYQLNIIIFFKSIFPRFVLARLFAMSVGWVFDY